MKTDRTRRHVLLASLTACIGLVAGAALAEYPERPITLIVPYSAGGSTETMARVFGKALGDELGQNVVIKTRPGGGGAVGSAEAAAADPDGYTLIFVSSDALIWPPMTQDVPYKTEDFDFVSQITNYQQAIVVAATAPFDTMEGLIEHAKSNALNYADQSALSRTFIDYIGAQEGVEWTGIPTKGGGEMVPFLLGGKIDFAYSGGIHGRYAEDMKVLMSMNSTPLMKDPDAPTIQSRYGIAMPSEAIIAAPNGLPDDVIARLEAAIEVAVQDGDFVTLMSDNLGFPINYANSADITAQMGALTEGMSAILATQ